MKLPVEVWLTPKAEKCTSEIHGRGLFAAEPIAAGEVIWVKTGHIVSAPEAEKLVAEVGDYVLQVTEELFLSPLTTDEVPDQVVFHNHSCDPNAGPEGQIVFVALRDIAAGEEITTDYATIVLHGKRHEFRMTCSCGARNCRGVITGEDWKLPELQQRYGLNFSWFILRQILAQKSARERLPNDVAIGG